jgi:hypothetical protein
MCAKEIFVCAMWSVGTESRKSLLLAYRGGAEVPHIVGSERQFEGKEQAKSFETERSHSWRTPKLQNTDN